MNDAKHQDAVECTLGALKQAEAFGVLPADCRGGPGNVGNERKDQLASAACTSVSQATTRAPAAVAIRE
jgi:hypothetical protein